MKLEREWVEELIFGSERLRRFLQDSRSCPMFGWVTPRISTGNWIFY